MLEILLMSFTQLCFLYELRIQSAMPIVHSSLLLLRDQSVASFYVNEHNYPPEIKFELSQLFIPTIIEDIICFYCTSFALYAFSCVIQCAFE